MRKSSFLNIGDWDWSLFISILLYQSIPLIYNSYNVYLIGNSIPNANGLGIISQWQFVQVGVEILQESLVLPIFFFVGSKLNSNDSSLIERRVTSALKIIILFLTPIIVLLFFQIDYFVSFVNTSQEIVNSTISYLRIKIWTVFFSVINLGLIVIIESLKEKYLLIKLLIIKMMLSISFDSWFFGRFNFSLDLGIEGVAISNLIVEGLLLIVLIFFLRQKININPFRIITFHNEDDFKIFGNISMGIGIESGVKNIAYFIMILSLLNSLGAKQIGGYYLSMQIFWGFLLIPIISLSDTLKVLIANNASEIKRVRVLLRTSLAIGFFLLILWVTVLPFAANIFNFLNTDRELTNYANIAFFTLFIPYGALSLNMIIDSVFYGLGQTKYLAYQSLITNLSVYFVAYILYKIGVWAPSFISVLSLFTIGILVDSMLTIIYVKRILK